MMVRKAFVSVLAAAVVGMLASAVSAAVVAPVKGYAKPDEPIVVKFLNEKGEAGKKALQEIGLPATKLEDLFAPAAATDVVGADGKPAFTLLSADGKALMPAGDVKANADGTVDLTPSFPQIKGGGTYYLLWKDAPPLVINCLYNPGRGAAELKRMQAQLQSLSPEDRKEALARFGPVVVKMNLAEVATITTDKGVIKAKFSYDVAPHTIDNFTTLSRQGFYDGSAFHRIISGFMIQGGDAYGNSPDMAGTGGPGYQIMHEFSDKKHERGTLSMARSSDPDSAGSQFFIMHAKAPNLDNQYSAFGDVIEGIEVVDAIAKTPTTGGNGEVKTGRPKIVSIKITPGTADQYGLKK
jgi:peptidyl-prolyl cis-trans isomerase B (cyclophilin B)